MANRRLLIVAAFLGVLVGPAVSRAYAINLRDLIALSKEGVSDAVLVAIIETDGSRFTLGPNDVRQLRSEGVSDAVIIAMLMSARSPVRPADVTTPVAPVTSEVDEPEPLERIEPARRAPAPAPVIINQTIVQKVEAPARREVRREEVPVYVPVYVPVQARPVEVKKEEPVYWGWGGKRRPDAWGETPAPTPSAPAKPAGPIIK